MDIIRERRSIRKFLPDAINEEDIIGILDAAMHAPSAGNQRPWHFIVFKDENNKNALAQTSPNARFASQVPVVILVCGNTQKETHRGYWPVDCSAAVENMLLEATQRNLGSLWLGVYPRSERIEYLSRLLNLPQHIIPFAMVCIGKPAENPSKRGYFDPSIVSFESFNNAANF